MVLLQPLPLDAETVAASADQTANAAPPANQDANVVRTATAAPPARGKPVVSVVLTASAVAPVPERPNAPRTAHATRASAVSQDPALAHAVDRTANARPANADAAKLTALLPEGMSYLMIRHFTLILLILLQLRMLQMLRQVSLQKGSRVRVGRISLTSSHK